MAYRLLIVPGDNEMLRALQGQLRSDIDVQVLNSANDALWEVRNSPPEAIIADVDLPGMSGLDLAAILPNFGVSTKIVLWSRAPDQQAAQQAAIHGVHQFLNGPQTPSALQDVLYEVLGCEPSRAAPVPVEPPAASPTAEPMPATTPAPARPRRERYVAPPPLPPGPVRKPSARRREGALVLTEENLPPIRNRLSELLEDVGAQCILLTDRAGMVLAEVGVSADLPTMVLLPLLSTTFSTAGQISEILHETDPSALYMQEGTHYDLYCFDVLQRFMLVMIFDKTVSATKIGTAWVYAKRAIRDMHELLA